MDSSHYVRSGPTYVVQLYVGVDFLAKLGTSSRTMLPQSATRYKVASIEWVCNHSTFVVWHRWERWERAISSKTASIDCGSDRSMSIFWGSYRYLRSFSCATSSKIASVACSRGLTMPVIWANCQIVSMMTPRSVSLLTFSRPQCTFHFSFQAGYVWVSRP